MIKRGARRLALSICVSSLFYLCNTLHQYSTIFEALSIDGIEHVSGSGLTASSIRSCATLVQA